MTTTPTIPGTAACTRLPRTERPAANLRTILGTNAATSLAAGLVATIGASWVADTFGIPSVTWTRIVGVGLIIFAIDVALVATRATRTLPTAVLAISAADIAWVVGTAVVLVTVDLTTTGQLAAVIMGAGVAAFAIAQLWFRRRLAA